MPDRGSLKKNSLAADFLLELADDFDLFLTYGYTPGKVQKYGMREIKRRRHFARLREKKKILEKLKKSNLLRTKEIGKRLHIALTENGAYQVFRLKVLNSDLFEDGRVCMVVFDIPESQKRLRQKLRRFLSEAAFIPIQRSVWISPFDAGDALMKLFALTGSRRWIRVFNGIEVKM
jgi:hypothetical protein